MQARLPKFIDPWKLTASGARLAGDLPLAEMPRLASMLSGADGSVAFALEAGVDAQGIKYLLGSAQTLVKMSCQRCMGAMTVPLQVDFRLGLVHSDDECSALPGHYEGLVAAEQGVSLSGLIEDELILSLPIVALHENPRECKRNGFEWSSSQQSVESQPERANPFAVLSTWLKKPNNRE